MPRVKSHTNNRGVTATGSDINESLSSKKEPSSLYPTNGLQNELRNVIELMGPNSPLTVNSSSEADNEDSYITSTSIYLEVKHIPNAEASELSENHIQLSCDTPRDISQISALPVDSARDESRNVREVERNNSINDKVAPLQAAAPEQPPWPHYVACPCREYVKNYQERISNRGVVVKQNEYTIVQKEQEHDRRGTIEKAINLFTSFKFRRPSKESNREPLDLYKINILQTNNNENSVPKRLVFDLIDDIPKPETNTVATNTVKEKPQTCANIHKPSAVPTPFHSYIGSSRYSGQPQYPKMKETHKGKQNTARVDVYYFDHGNASYFRTTDCPPAMVTEVIAEKTEAYTTRFWAEFFGTIHIGFSFLTSFILQLVRFLLQSLVRPLTVGLMQLTSDYFFKPFLAVIFNAIIQPPLIFCYNIATSLRDLADPIAEAVGYFLREIANVCRGIRLVEVNKAECRSPTVPLRKRNFKCVPPKGLLK